MTDFQPNSSSRWRPGAAVAAWVLPGLGHFILGQRRRGATLCVVICTLWLAGLVIGGLSIMDRREHPAWFAGQVLMSPSLLLDLTIEYRLKPDPHPMDPIDHPRYEPSFAHVNEQGVLYTALAGLLNLLAILDVLYLDPKRMPDAAAPAPGSAPGGTRGTARGTAPGNSGPTAASPAAPRGRNHKAFTGGRSMIAGLLKIAPSMLGYTVFLDPLPVDTYWLALLPPLVLAIAIVYKAIKLDDLNQLPRQALSLASQIFVFMVLAAAALWLLTELV